MFDARCMTDPATPSIRISQYKFLKDKSKAVSGGVVQSHEAKIRGTSKLQQMESNCGTKECSQEDEDCEKDRKTPRLLVSPLLSPCLQVPVPHTVASQLTLNSSYVPDLLPSSISAFQQSSLKKNGRYSIDRISPDCNKRKESLDEYNNSIDYKAKERKVSFARNSQLCRYSIDMSSIIEHSVINTKTNLK